MKATAETRSTGAQKRYHKCKHLLTVTPIFSELSALGFPLQMHLLAILLQPYEPAILYYSWAAQSWPRYLSMSIPRDLGYVAKLRRVVGSECRQEIDLSRQRKSQSSLPCTHEQRPWQVADNRVSPRRWLGRTVPCSWGRCI